MEFYTGSSFDSFANEIKKAVDSEIFSQPDDYILNVSIEDFTLYLTEKHKIDTPILYVEDVYAISVEKEIPPNQFSYGYLVQGSVESLRRQVIIYHLPYSGSIKILNLRPNPYNLSSGNFQINNEKKCILIEIVNYSNDLDNIIKHYQTNLNIITSNYQHIKGNCDEFNSNLSSYIKLQIEKRRESIFQHNSILASIGVPIKSKESVPETFSIPKPKLREKIIIKPTVLQNEFIPEPTLDSHNYQKILKIINDFGKNLERMPSTYKEKKEEDIRDYLLMVLDPNFEMGSAGGETFNKKGKTDISIRYDSNVVFIAECKYWKGEQGFLKTIDQLLGYLTWRNSKTAIINFVQNKEFTEVLKKIQEITKTHSNYLTELKSFDENWFNYKFHLIGDRNRELELAIISFHFPK